MSVFRCSTSAQRLAILSAALAVHMMAESAVPTSAQGLFESLFGGFQHAPVPSQARSYTPPTMKVASVPSARLSSMSGRSVAYCVRLCDGRFFPTRRQDAAGLCNTLCPASSTKVFSGSDIRHAVAADGTRYGGLKNAFAFRSKLVEDCTCNGKDHFGLASIDSTSDPTVRPSDIVVTPAQAQKLHGPESNQTARQSVISSASN